MKPQLGYLPVESVYPHQGLDTTDPSTLINPKLSPNLQNMNVLDGLVEKRKGILPIGASNGQLPDVAVVMALVNFQTVTGLNYLIAITTAKQYYFDDATNDWINITLQTLGSDVDLTGTQSDLISHVEVVGLDAGKVFIFTNGVDKPRYWDGDITHKFALVTFNYPNFVTCKTLSTQNDRLIMGAITDTVYTPQNVAWSDAGKVNEWLAGTAGVQSLFNTDGAIQALVPLANSIAVYAEDSIHLMSYIGGDVIYEFQKIQNDTRLVSSNGIANLGPFHIFMSQDNFMLFDGSRNIIPVGDAIHKGYRNELNTAYKYRSYAFVEKVRRRIYFAVPTSATVLKHYVLEYNISSPQQSRWWVHEYNRRLSAMGFYVSNTTLAWNSSSLSTTTWSGYVASWSGSVGVKGFPIRVVGDSGGITYYANEASPSDYLGFIEGIWESVDFTIPQEYQSELMRVQQIELELKGGSVQVYYSTDKGATYTLHSDQALSSDWSTYRLFLDTVSRTIRVKLRNFKSDEGFSFRWLRVWFTPSGPY